MKKNRVNDLTYMKKFKQMLDLIAKALNRGDVPNAMFNIGQLTENVSNHVNEMEEYYENENECEDCDCEEDESEYDKKMREFGLALLKMLRKQYGQKN